VSLSISPPVCL